jgi:hypothetical protein
MDEIIFKDKQGKQLMKLTGEELKISDEMKEIQKKKKKEKEKEIKEKKNDEGSQN